MLFPEPRVARTSWLGWSEPRVHWLTECLHAEAVMSRATVNEWYQQFPDPEGRMAQRLRSEIDVDHLQALDELFVHRILRQRHEEVRYEEGGVGPDFRVYEQGELMLAVEVATLFMRSDWNDDDRRHNRLADALNRLVRPSQGYFVSFDIKVAPSEPAPRHFAEWIAKELSRLPPHTNLSGSGYDDIPTAIYERKGVRIEVRFLPMKADAHTRSDPEARIVGTGRMTVGFVNSGSRLKDAISKKGGGRYDIGSVPYVVAVGNRDSFLSGDVVVDGLYGNDAVRFDFRDPSRVEALRENNGLFGYDPARRRVRHSRISAVAVLSDVRLWDPTTADVALYDNLSPLVTLPDGLFPATRRFAQVSPSGEFGWRPV